MRRLAGEAAARLVRWASDQGADAPLCLGWQEKLCETCQQLETQGNDAEGASQKNSGSFLLPSAIFEAFASVFST